MFKCHLGGNYTYISMPTKRTPLKKLHRAEENKTYIYIHSKIKLKQKRPQIITHMQI